MGTEHDNAPRQLEHGIGRQLSEGHFCPEWAGGGARDEYGAGRAAWRRSSIDHEHAAKAGVFHSPLVEYERHRGVRLSVAGRRRALEIVRHHRLLEAFLYEVLDYPIEEVHDEAERLEHFISERFEERIDAKLGRPKFDPHGHCIPALNGKMSTPVSMPLTDVEEDGKFVLDSVSDRDAPLLKRLKAHGITPGARLQVSIRSQEEFVLRVGSNSKTLHLSLDLAGAVRIRSAD